MDQPVNEHPLDQNDEKLAWHRPFVQRLEVALDTRDSGGSSADGAFGTLTQIDPPSLP